MATARDLRRRIRSIKNTSQITKAMQMVAAAKMRKAQMAALAGRPYAELLNRVLAEVSHAAGDFSHPLLEARRVHRRAVILVSTDKGLCGALNSNLFREALKYDTATTLFIAAGRKGAQFVARTKRQLEGVFEYKDAPRMSEARSIVEFATNLFLAGKVDQVDVLFTNFISTLNQKAESRTLLPIGKLQAVSADFQGERLHGDLAKATGEFLFEPGAAQVFEALLPHYLNFLMYQYLLEAKASEHSARMVAMKNATDNALQLIKSLTLQYNKMRQAAITKELLEITSAAKAMEAS